MRKEAGKKEKEGRREGERGNQQGRKQERKERRNERGRKNKERGKKGEKMRLRWKETQQGDPEESESCFVVLLLSCQCSLC